MKRLLICGDRHWRHRGLIRRVLLHAKPDVVIEGEAPGADTLAREIAERLGIPVEKYPAHWTTQGKSAGMRRNQRMLDEGKPTEVIAFHDHIHHSRGTRDMCRRALDAGLKVTVVTSQGIGVTLTRAPAPTPQDLLF